MRQADVTPASGLRVVEERRDDAVRLRRRRGVLGLTLAAAARCSIPRRVDYKSEKSSRRSRFRPT